MRELASLLLIMIGLMMFALGLIASSRSHMVWGLVLAVVGAVMSGKL